MGEVQFSEGCLQTDREGAVPLLHREAECRPDDVCHPPVHGGGPQAVREGQELRAFLRDSRRAPGLTPACPRHERERTWPGPQVE